MKNLFILFKLITILISAFLFSCSNEDPRLIEFHNTYLVFENDSIKMDELKLLSHNDDSFPSAFLNDLTQSEMNEITSRILNGMNYKNILSADLLVKTDSALDLKNISINSSEVKHIGVYYVEENQINYDLHFLHPDGKADLKMTYAHLSNSNCGVSLMLFIKNYTVSDPDVAMIGFALKKSELPDFSELELRLKKEDSLYLETKRFYEKYKN